MENVKGREVDSVAAESFCRDHLATTNRALNVGWGRAYSNKPACPSLTTSTCSNVPSAATRRNNCWTTPRHAKNPPSLRVLISLPYTLLITPARPRHVEMKANSTSLSLGLCSLFLSASATEYVGGNQEPLRAPIDPTKYRAACPDYKSYAMRQQYVMPRLDCYATS
jgi:hypothetical protein